MLKSRWSKVLGIVSLTALLAGFAGCNKPTVSNAGDDESDVAAAESELGQPEPMRHGPPGPAMLLGAALHHLELTDAQKTTIQGELDALRADADAHKKDHDAARSSLAAAVRSGKIDEAALLAQAPKPPADQARVAKALTVLHDTLTAAQRKQLVDAVAAKMDRHEGREDRPAREHEGKRGPDGERGEHGPGMFGPMGHLLHDLDLTDAQREAIRDAMKKNAPSEADREAMKAAHEGMRKAMRERIESFASDKFDATAMAAPPADAKMGPKEMFGGMVKMLATVTPILNDTQREALARRIEEGPMGPPHARKEHGRGE